MQIFNDSLVFILSGFQSWVAGITIWPFIFSKKYYRGDVRHTTHERIHLRQQLECLLVFFPIIYFGQYLWFRAHRINHMDAYKKLSFEQEAYANHSNLDYLKTRKMFAWHKYK